MENNYMRMGNRKLGKAEDGSRCKTIVDYVKADQEFMDGIRKGAKACKEGRVRRWLEIKKELNL